MNKTLIFLLTIMISATLGDEPRYPHIVLVSGVTGIGGMCSVNMFAEVQVARLYHIFINNGIPRDNIIVFMNGEMGNSSDCNPHPGHLYQYDWTDLMEGLRIDYSSYDVTAENLFAVLKGNATGVQGGSGRVLQSGSEDRVIVSHSSHGSAGWLQMGPASGIKKQPLNDALKEAKKLKKFKQLIYFVEACESGNTFFQCTANKDNDCLYPNEDIFAITATGINKPGFIIDCKNYTNVTHTTYCRASSMDKAWIRYMTEVNFEKETIGMQIRYMWERTLSYVHFWGSSTVPQESAGIFQGHYNGTKDITEKMLEFENDPDTFTIPLFSNASYVAMLKNLEMNPDLSKDQSFMNKLKKMEQKRASIQKMTRQIVELVAKDIDHFKMNSMMNNKPGRIQNLECHDDIFDIMLEKCIQINKSPFINDFIDPILNLCEADYKVENILKAIDDNCMQFKMN